MNAKELFKKSIARALTAPGNLVAGLSSVLLTLVADGNPLPLIFYGIGAGLWVKHAVASHRYDDEIMATANQATQSQAHNAQAQLEQEVRSLFDRPVVRRFIGQSLLPDYLRTYDELVVIRDDAAEIARTRRDVASTMEDEIISKLDQMLVGYLRLARARVMYAHVLFGVYGNTAAAREPREDQDGEENIRQRRRLRDVLFVREEKSRPRRRISRETDFDSDFKDLETRIRELTSKIEGLQREAEAKPNVAQILGTHIDMLKKQIELLRRSNEQDQRVTAQLDALPAAFNYILDSVRATQFTADKVTTYMSGVIQEVDDTIRFVEAVQIDDFPSLGLVEFSSQRQTNQ